MPKLWRHVAWIFAVISDLASSQGFSPSKDIILECLMPANRFADAGIRYFHLSKSPSWNLKPGDPTRIVMVESGDKPNIRRNWEISRMSGIVHMTMTIEAPATSTRSAYRESKGPVYGSCTSIDPNQLKF